MVVYEVEKIKELTWMTPPPAPEELKKWSVSPKRRAHQSIIAISSSVHAGLLVHCVDS